MLATQTTEKNYHNIKGEKLKVMYFLSRLSKVVERRRMVHYSKEQSLPKQVYTSKPSSATA